MTTPPSLANGTYYHIYNRGNNRENIFIETRNYYHFMQLYTRYVEPVADTFAYCLLRNHFHFLVRTKTEEEIKTFRVSGTRKVSSPSQQFGILFNAYAKAINSAYGRTGSLFQKPFGRVAVRSQAHLLRLVTYIHRNPEKHGFVDDFRQWPYSSYQAAISTSPTRVRREDLVEWFGGLEGLKESHQKDPEIHMISYLIGDD